MNKAKRKLLISVLVMMFILISVVATVAIIFAATQQTITTTLNMTYTAENIYGSVSGSYTIGGVTENLTASTGGDDLVFQGKPLQNGTLNFPTEQIDMTSEASEMILQYTFTNSGRRHYIATMSFESIIDPENMTVQYSIDGDIYSDQRYAVVVQEETTRSYWIKIGVTDKSQNASFKGDFIWNLEDTDDMDEATYLSLDAVEFEGDDVSQTYAASYNGQALTNGVLYVPSEVNGDPVTTITKNSSLTQEQKNQVTSVYIPNNITSINSGSFEYYQSLKQVQIETGSNAGEISAQSITGLTTIGYGAFNFCSALEEINIPKTVTKMSGAVFANCTALDKVIIESVDKWSQISFTDAVSNPVYFSKKLTDKEGNTITSIALSNSITSIKYNTFRNNTALISISIPNSVNTIERYAFNGCSNLLNLTIPSGVTTIEEYAFSGCKKIQDLTIPSNVETLGNYSFSSCGGLQNLIFEGSVDIGVGAFSSCGLNSLEISSTVGRIDSSAFASCSNLKDVSIKGGVLSNNVFADTPIENLFIDTEIVPANNFENRTALKTVTIGENVESVSALAFTGCSGLELGIIYCKRLENSAFQNCSNLKEITFGGNVEFVGPWCFENCNSLEIINFERTPTLGAYCFSGCNNIRTCNISDLDALLSIWGTGAVSLLNGNTTMYLNGEVVTDIIISNNVYDYDDNSTCILQGYKAATKLTFDSNITRIGSNIFSDMAGLREVYIANSVTEIGTVAFKNVNATFYCEATSKPEGWAEDWAPDAKKIVWGYKASHTCTASDELNYYVEDEKAYSYNACEKCGSKLNVTEITDAIIVNAGNVQSVLDSNINGKTVVFAPGVYSEIIDIRPSKATAKVYAFTGTEFVLGEEITGELSNDATYNYVREVKDVTLVAADGACFTNLLRVCSQSYTIAPSIAQYDAVRETDNVPRYVNMNIDGLVIKNFKFSGAEGRIAMKNVSTNQSMKFKNITITNNSFVLDANESLSVKEPFNQSTQSATSLLNAATVLYTTLLDKFENITYTNNYVSNHFQGITTMNVDGISIKNNVVNSTLRQAFTVQNTTYYFTGTIEISNNIVNTTVDDRAIRFGVGGAATIVVKDNQFNNCAPEGSLLKTQKAYAGMSCNYTFTNNTYNGNTITDDSGSFDDNSQWEVVVE